MLREISKRQDYLSFKETGKARLTASDLLRLESEKYKSASEKMDSLEPERAEELLLSCYSQVTGRPANDPVLYIRSCLLMLHFSHTSVDEWVATAKSDILLQYLIGSWNVPSVACHYDFINRLTGSDPHLDELYPKSKNSKEVKAQIRAAKLKKGEKWENFDDGDTQKLKKQYWNDASCDADRWTRVLERLLDLMVVQPSYDKYIQDGEDFILSGDGSALHIHSSPHGHHVENPVDDQHTHRYTAPDADLGWDSHEGVVYLGFTLYTMSFHSGKHGIDLPMFIAQRTASQHDSLTTITATAHMLDINPSLLPKYMCFDSASDAAHIHQFLRHRGTIPIIDWNPRHTDPDNPYAKHPIKNALKDENGNSLEHLNEKGIPVCACGKEMVRDGYDTSKMATKYRCPFIMGRMDSCPYSGKCTDSPYGRVIKTYDKTDYKLFGPVMYGSEQWKEIYKNRTCTERINNRILNDYKVHSLTCRNGPKHFFFSIMAAINIHLDAWQKTANA